MNHPYYTNDDQPTAAEREQMWQQIDSQHPSGKASGTTITLHWKSFLFGNVAAALVMLAAYGIWSVFNQGRTDLQLSTDLAYEQGMQLMMESSADLVASAPKNQRELLEAKMMSIEDIDRAIEEIRNDMVMHGITPMNQRQLRTMYALKLDYLKELIITGDLES
jgi:hypothetical protein